MSKKMRNKREKMMERQEKKTYEHQEIKPANEFEQSIARRAKAAGYFCVDIEVLSNLSMREKIIYKQNEDMGIKSLEMAIKTEEDYENYTDCKRDYLKILGELACRGEIEVNTSSLTNEELKCFNDGYEFTIVRGLTPAEVIEEYKKHKETKVSQRVRK